MGFSLLGIINAISPKEGSTARVARDIPFGISPRQKLDIYAPRQRGGAALPVLNFIYGGSWSDGDKNHYDFVGRALASLGYIVVIANYRLLPEVEYPAFLKDSAAAVDWVVANVGGYGGDADRIGLIGHSAGAYNAMMVLFDPAYLRAAGHFERVRAVAGLSGPYDFYPFAVPITQRTFGAVADPEATQPVNLVPDDAPPAFLAHGDADTLVLPRNTVALARKLREKGCVVVEKHYLGKTHPMTLMPIGRLLRHKVPVLADLAAFFAAHLR